MGLRLYMGMAALAQRVNLHCTQQFNMDDVFMAAAVALRL